jgi:putative transposase
MILTYKFVHNRDFSTELDQAFKVANFVVENPKCKSSKIVKDFGLKSAISNQILKKYGHSKTIKHVNNVMLTVPGQGVKYYPETNSIWISCIKLHMENLIPVNFTKINQIELDNDYAYISVTVPEPEVMPYTSIIGVDRNTTGHIVVTANVDTGQVRKMGKSPVHIRTKYRNIRTKLQKSGKHRNLKQIKNRENRIVKDLNHKISKELVNMAKVQHAALVFEDLGGIRNTKK